MLVSDTRPGPAGSFPENLTNVNGTLFLVANDGSTGYDLWATDERPPRIVCVTPPANGTYRAGQTLDVLVRFSEAVVVGTTATSRPYVSLRIGSLIRNAEFFDRISPTTLRFRYVVRAGDFDNDGIEILSPVIRPAGTSIRNLAGNHAGIIFTSPSTPNVRVDAVAPRIAAVIPPANGRYVTGQMLEFRVRFREAVNIPTTATNRPQLRLRIGNVIRNAVFVNNGQRDDGLFPTRFRPATAMPMVSRFYRRSR